MLRSVGAVVAGFITMALVVMACTFAWMAIVVPGGLKAMRSGNAGGRAPSPTYLAANLVYSFIAAVAGGWVTTRIAIGAPLGHLAALAAVVLVMGALSARGSGSEGQPAWYRFIIPIIGVAGVFASTLV